MSINLSSLSSLIESNQRQRELMERRAEENERIAFLLEEDLVTTPNFQVRSPSLIKAGDKISSVSSKTLGAVSGTGATATTVLSIKAATVGIIFPITTAVISGISLTSLGMKYFASKPFTTTIHNSIEVVFSRDREVLKIARLPFFGLKIKPTPSSREDRVLLTIDERMEIDIRKNKHIINGIEVPPNFTIQLTEIEKLLPPREGENYLLINTISKLLNTRLMEDLKDKVSLYIIQNPTLLSTVSAQNFSLRMLDCNPSIELTLHEGKVQIATALSWKIIEADKEEPVMLKAKVVHDLIDNSSHYKISRTSLKKPSAAVTPDRQPLLQ